MSGPEQTFNARAAVLGEGAAAPAGLGLGLDAPAPSVEAREAQCAQLARTLCDLAVLPAGRISANERALVADMLIEILSATRPALRTAVARRVGRVRECPPALVRHLLLDEPAVAAALLQSADRLPEALVIECARKGTTAHREAIARRVDLTPGVADAVLEFDEPTIAQLLLRRHDCEFSPGAIGVFMARAAGDADLQTMLLQRRELEPAHGFLMFWWVDAERRRRILTRFALDRSVIQDALGELYTDVFGDGGDAAAAHPLVREILTVLDRRHRPRDARGEPIPMQIVARTLKVARRSLSDDVLQAGSMIAGVSKALAARILRDPGGEPLAILAKGVGLPREMFREILGAAGEAGWAYTPEGAEGLVAVFDTLSRDYARAILRYWDWEGNPRIVEIAGRLAPDTDEPPRATAKFVGYKE